MAGVVGPGGFEPAKQGFELAHSCLPSWLGDTQRIHTKLIRNPRRNPYAIPLQDTGGAGSDTLVNFENLTGSAYDDTLTGVGNANTLKGLAGDDTLNGGAGNDTASYADAGSGVNVSLALQGSAQDTSGAGTDTLSNIENLTGSAFDDTLTG